MIRVTVTLAEDADEGVVLDTSARERCVLTPGASATLELDARSVVVMRAETLVLPMQNPTVTV